jgi:hypothetical protein
MQEGTIFQKHSIHRINSVFPATTAAAITTFLTGTAPQQHASTGWFVNLREIGAIFVPLRFIPRFADQGVEGSGLKISDLIGKKPFTEGLRTKNYAVLPKDLKATEYSKNFFACSEMMGYRTMSGFTRQIKKALSAKKTRKKFIYAYVPFFDACCHELGVGSMESYLQFREIEAAIRPLIRAARDTTILITADHGMIDTTEKRTIFMSDHPKFKECLSLPLCGEPRCAFCYVHTAKTGQFRSYYKKHFRKMADLVPSEKLIEDGYFGLFQPDKELIHRIGDFALVAKKNYCFQDSLINEEPHMLVGNHGGISEDEIYVPLIVI